MTKSHPHGPSPNLCLFHRVLLRYSVSHLLESVGTFARNFEATDPTNPYRVTLRKLWAKLAEKNWRTTLKALYLLHSLASKVEPEDAVNTRRIKGIRI